MSPLTFARTLACLDETLRPAPQLPGCRHFTPLPGDGWSHHPYSVDRAPGAPDPDPDSVRMGDILRLTGLMHDLRAAGRTARELPVYITEFGYQTDPPDPTQHVSLAKQATWLAQAEQQARAPRVRSTAQFLIRDLPARPGRDLRTRWRDYQSGLRLASGRAKPALAAYALPLVVRDAGARLQVWGLVRPGTGRQPVTLQHRAPGDPAWHDIDLAFDRTEADGVLETTIEPSTQASPTDRFRLLSGGRAGAEVGVTR
jgi:hypothetical protein